MANIRTVAEKAKVSVSTVSRVFNDTSPVSEELRMRVLKAAKELDYHPNLLARALVSKETKTIGIVVPFFTSHFFVEVLRGIDSVLSGNGYDIILYNVETTESLNNIVSRVGKEERIDGTIVISLPLTKEQVKLFQKGGKPLIMLDTNNPHADFVGFDNIEGGRLAVRHLVEVGHRDIAYIGGCGEKTNQLRLMAGYQDQNLKAVGDLRLRGYETELKAQGIELRKDLIVAEEYSYQGGYRGIEELLKRKCKFSAVFASTDVQAIGALNALREQNVQIPGDVAVIGFDDLEIAQVMGLSTVRQNTIYMGMLASRWLLIQLKGRSKVGRKSRFIKPELVVRTTTA